MTPKSRVKLLENLEKFLGLTPTRASQELNWIQEFASKKNLDLNELVRQRLSGKPLAYIMGEWDFYGRTFKVTPDVLIPRPETEQLVDIVLKNENFSQYTHIFDIGTGSGVLGISLALEVPGISVIATDVSASALQIAKLNAKNLSCSNITFVQSHLLDEIELGEKNLIIANLPYIPSNTPLDPQVTNFEPHEALFAGPDGLNLILPLIQTCKGHDCNLWLEIDASHLEKIPGKNVQYLKSLQGDYRFAFVKTS